MSGRRLVFTGDGKGKTTAALGMVLRAWGHGEKAVVIQFIKADGSTGEARAIAKLPGVHMAQAGLGFVPKAGSAKFSEHAEAARAALAAAAEEAANGDADLLVLDEIANAVSLGLISERDVPAALERARPELDICLTGRDATPGLIAWADTVTEMRCVKHAMEVGREAEAGVEY